MAIRFPEQYMQLNIIPRTNKTDKAAAFTRPLETSERNTTKKITYTHIDDTNRTQT